MCGRPSDNSIRPPGFRCLRGLSTLYLKRKIAKGIHICLPQQLWPVSDATSQTTRMDEIERVWRQGPFLSRIINLETNIWRHLWDRLTEVGRKDYPHTQLGCIGERSVPMISAEGNSSPTRATSSSVAPSGHKEGPYCQQPKCLCRSQYQVSSPDHSTPEPYDITRHLESGGKRDGECPIVLAPYHRSGASNRVVNRIAWVDRSKTLELTYFPA